MKRSVYAALALLLLLLGPVRAESQFLPHPAGCPRVAYCGCGASVETYGGPMRNLYLAAAWLRFPRAEPAPGMAAARRGHVFVLRQHVRDRIWLVADHNSGGRRSRLHHRSIAGFTIVDPTGGAAAPTEQVAEATSR